MEGECHVLPLMLNKSRFFLNSRPAWPCQWYVCVCAHISVCVWNVHTTCMHLCPLQITVYDQENFQGKRLEFTSACQNIMECGVDNIRSLKLECGAWVKPRALQNITHMTYRENMYILKQLKCSADPISDHRSVLWSVLMHVCFVCYVTAGQDMSTPASVDSSLCWREESILTGSHGAAATPTTLRGWCPSAPSALLWVFCPTPKAPLSPAVDVSWTKFNWSN